MQECIVFLGREMLHVRNREVQNSAMGHSQFTTMHLKRHSLIDTSDEDY